MAFQLRRCGTEQIKKSLFENKNTSHIRSSKSATGASKAKSAIGTRVTVTVTVTATGSKQTRQYFLHM
jgi:hypothetical protein